MKRTVFDCGNEVMSVNLCLMEVTVIHGSNTSMEIDDMVLKTWMLKEFFLESSAVSDERSFRFVV